MWLCWHRSGRSSFGYGLSHVPRPLPVSLQCVAGYHGVNCSEEINECLSHPCQNGGTCIDLTNMYKCSCPRGTQGKDRHTQGCDPGESGQSGTPRPARGIPDPARTS